MTIDMELGDMHERSRRCKPVVAVELQCRFVVDSGIHRRDRDMSLTQPSKCCDDQSVTEAKSSMFGGDGESLEVARYDSGGRAGCTDANDDEAGGPAKATGSECLMAVGGAPHPNEPTSIVAPDLSEGGRVDPGSTSVFEPVEAPDAMGRGRQVLIGTDGAGQE